MVEIEKEVLIDFYKRYDQMGYQVFGISEDWYLRRTVRLLTCFSMEANGQFGNETTLKTYDALFGDYLNYICGLLRQNRIKFYCDEEPTPNEDRSKGIDIDNTYFKRDDLLEDLESRNDLNIDVVRLKRFLAGAEAPNVTKGSKSLSRLIDSKYKIVDGFAIVPDKVDTVKCATDSATTSNQFSFIKVGKKWSIRFYNVALDDLKHNTGMGYIKILLQDPYREVGVYDLQAMMNEELIDSSKAKIRKDKMTDYIDDEEEQQSHSNIYIINDELDFEPIKYDSVDKSSVSNVDCTLARLIKFLSADKKKQVATIYYEIEKLRDDLKDATDNNDIINVSRLNSLLSMLNDDMYNIVYSRSDDPEVESNRKKVYKNIKDARERIQEAEIKAGYMDAPVYNYLSKYINTGSYCQYNPPADEIIHWVF